jgi:crossover junction endodeoxyribonuclease RuvC
MTSTYLGIDPGLKGGLATFQEPLLDGDRVCVRVMPVEGKWIQCQRIVDWLQVIAPIGGRNIHAIVEQVGSMPKQGLSSTFKFGTGYGQIIGMLQTLEIPYTLVRPQAWKGVVLAGTSKDKAAAIAFCAREYPGVPLIPERCRVPHDGIADALCLVHYGRLKHVSG